MTAVIEKCKAIPLDKIEVDPEVQPREIFSAEIVEEYAEAMSYGAKFPDLIVFEDGGRCLLADGHFRLEATRRLEVPPKTVKCRVLKGNKRDAMLWAASANTDHGARRTNADKRRAVLRLLDDKQWSGWSDRKIADHCGVSNNFVSDLRKKQLSSDDSCQYNLTREGLDGKVRKPPTKKTKPKHQEKAKAVPTAPARESYPGGGNHAPNEDDDCCTCLEAEITAGAETTWTQATLSKELQAAITPLISHWPSRAQFGRALREIADNIESAIEREEALV